MYGNWNRNFDPYACMILNLTVIWEGIQAKWNVKIWPIGSFQALYLAIWTLFAKWEIQDFNPKYSKRKHYNDRIQHPTILKYHYGNWFWCEVLSTFDFFCEFFWLNIRTYNTNTKFNWNWCIFSPFRADKSNPTKLTGLVNKWMKSGRKTHGLHAESFWNGDYIYIEVCMCGEQQFAAHKNISIIYNRI